MKKYLYIITILFSFFLLPSCEMDEDFVERAPQGNYTDVAVFSNLGLTESFVNNIYPNIWSYPFSFVTIADYVDEGQSLYSTDNINVFCNSGFSEDGITGWWNQYQMINTRRFNWGELYQVVRQTNLVLTQIDKIAVNNLNDVALKKRLKGESFFIRGLAYHFLTSLYGGVPIVEKVFEPSEDVKLARDSYEACVSFIVEQLDSAANNLPLDYNGNNSNNLGRATKGAALALKSRVLLYAASDLHHNMQNYAPGYSHPELLGYVGGDRQSYWKAAKDAAKAVIDLGIYELYKAEPSPGDSVAKNISDYFLTKSMTTEDILYQRFGPETNLGWDGGQAQMVWNGGGWNGWGTSTVIGDLVDDYERNDGTIFDWNNPVHAADPYTNRDARLYATVLYEGAGWIKRPATYSTYDPFDKYQFGTIKNTSGTLLWAGLDNRNGKASSANNCAYSGYNIRKAIDPALTSSYSNDQWIPFRHFRYAEILLNYAEACIGLGEENEARIYINKVRKRAGQPPIDALITGNELVNRYRNERRIELALENHRFFDVRRWLIGPQAYHNIHGVNVSFTVPDGTAITGYFKNSTTGDKWSVPVFTRSEIETRSWKDKSYFFPILRTELGRNNALVQNPGYGGL